MPKGPKGQRPPSIWDSIEAWNAKPQRTKLNAAERHDLRAAELQLFAKQVGRKAHAGHDPNDRRYSRSTVDAVRHMKPEVLDELLRDGED
jgi:hypothetical protein